MNEGRGEDMRGEIRGIMDDEGRYVQAEEIPFMLEWMVYEQNTTGQNNINKIENTRL